LYARFPFFGSDVACAIEGIDSVDLVGGHFSKFLGKESTEKQNS